MQAMSLHLHKMKTQALQPVKIKSKVRAIDMHIIFHINVILNDSWKFLMQVYEKSYNACRSSSHTVQ